MFILNFFPPVDSTGFVVDMAKWKLKIRIKLTRDWGCFWSVYTLFFCILKDIHFRASENLLIFVRRVGGKVLSFIYTTTRKQIELKWNCVSHLNSKSWRLLLSFLLSESTISLKYIVKMISPSKRVVLESTIWNRNRKMKAHTSEHREKDEVWINICDSFININKLTECLNLLEWNWHGHT